MKKIIFLFFILVSNAEARDNCQSGNVKIIFDKKPVTTKEFICSKKTSDNMLFYISKSCLQDKCEILKRTKANIVIKDYRGNIGSPGFKLCQALGGIPQIYEFQNETTERCLFGKNDFVEISLLTHEWKIFIKTN